VVGVAGTGNLGATVVASEVFVDFSEVLRHKLTKRNLVVEYHKFENL
jgi:hypothetical protein